MPAIGVQRLRRVAKHVENRPGKQLPQHGVIRAVQILPLVNADQAIRLWPVLFVQKQINLQIK